MKKFFEEFKEFISKGDVMTMAVGIIIGAAFTAIITSLVNDIITPLIGIIIGGLDFAGIAVTVGSAKLMVGNFISAIINFLLTAIVLFLIVRSFNRMTKAKEAALAKLVKKGDKEAEAEAEEEVPADISLLMEIRDLLKDK